MADDRAALAGSLGFEREPGEPESWTGPGHSCVSLDHGDQTWSAFDRDGDLVDDGFDFEQALYAALSRGQT